MRNGWGRAWPQIRFVGSAALAAVVMLCVFVGALVGLTSCVGCASSTSIKGGESSAQAVTSTSKMRVNVTHPNIQPEPVRVRVIVKERGCSR